MSICGRVAADPEQPLPLDRLVDALAPASAVTWRRPQVALAALEGMLASCNRSGRAVVFDGRIDNRAEVAAALGHPLECGDADLALRAFEKWDQDFAVHLFGDFSCGVWDGATRRVLLTTDPGAMRPLYYWSGRNELRFASEARVLATDRDVAAQIDSDRVARWLCLVPGEEGQSFFEGIRRVPPGTTVVSQDNVTTVSRWWRPEHIASLQLRSDSEYVEAARSMMARAVTDRVVSSGSVASQLSGGLDSSAVTAFAADALARDGRRLTAFTAAPNHVVRERGTQFGDEWPYAAAVARRFANITHRRVANDDRPLFEVLALREARHDVPIFNPFNTIWINAIEREAAVQGATVMLTGAMGNMSFSYSGSIGSSAAQARDLARAFMPPFLRRSLRTLAGRSRSSLIEQVAINPDFLAKSGLGEVVAAGTARVYEQHRNDDRAIRLAMLRQSDIRGDYAAGSRRIYGIDTRDPTIDRRLVEFCLAIPEEQFARRGESRSLARRMLRDVLPADVVEERRKGLQAADWPVSFAAAVPEMKAEVARLRASPAAGAWLDLDRIDRALASFATAPSVAEHQLATTRALAVGRFIRSLEAPAAR